ncbi:MAG: hypothetical protein EXS44_02585 [Candidatus Levybacteria bacterium]|nr:hypothetical protein [Candidatus Levybacteria bacterium]
MSEEKKQKTKMGSTQLFTEVKDIVDHVVFINNGSACSILQIEAINFSLLSDREQLSIIGAYANILNSLSFSIQISIRSKQVDISSYVRLLNKECERKTIHAELSQEKNQSLIMQIKKYRDFIQSLVMVNSVLDKSFYVILSFSPLEQGVIGVVNGSHNLIDIASSNLKAKAEIIQGELKRFSLRSNLLLRDELIRVYYDIYNEGQSSPNSLVEGISSPIVKGGM